MQYQQAAFLSLNLPNFKYQGPSKQTYGPFVGIETNT